MANNKVQLADGTTLIDLTEDTVTPQTMLYGETAHDRSGEQITGTLITTELPFIIVRQPQPVAVSADNSTVTFDIIVAGGSGTYTYQWQFMSGGTSWINRGGATDSSVDVAAYTVTDTITRCIVSDGVTTLYSDPTYYYGLNNGVTGIREAVNDGNYGICITAGNVQTKEVSIPGLVVQTGVTIHVYFTYTNNATDPKLSVNKTPGKYMVLYGTTKFGTATDTNGWRAGAVVSLTYDGTYWVRDQGYNTTIPNVQSDWEEASISSESYIKNKPTNLVSDASYVHTDNNFTSTLKTKLDGIENGAEANVQADWSEDDTSSDAYINNKPSIPTNTSDLTNDSGFIDGLVILTYGSSTWQDFLDAYTAQKVVYCRASSGANPASGAKTRLAFMAYVDSESVSSITSAEFQYYRSVSSHSETQQGDQVYVYKLTKTGGWSVTVREAYTKIAAGINMSQSYSSGILTLSYNGSAPPDPATSTPLVDSGNGVVGTSVKYAREDHVHPSDTSKLDASLKGALNGVAELDSTGKVPASQLPTLNNVSTLEYVVVS